MSACMACWDASESSDVIRVVLRIMCAPCYELLNMVLAAF